MNDKDYHTQIRKCWQGALQHKGVLDKVADALIDALPTEYQNDRWEGRDRISSSDLFGIAYKIANDGLHSLEYRTSCEDDPEKSCLEVESALAPIASAWAPFGISHDLEYLSRGDVQVDFSATFDQH